MYINDYYMEAKGKGNIIRILLLSDIHWLAVAEELDHDSAMRKAFLMDVEDYCNNNGAFDYILISGDIAYKGCKNEYTKALDFLRLLCQKTKCELEQIYVIPGNHDKNFAAEGSAERHVLHSGLSNEASDSDKLFNELLSQDFNSIKELYKPFEEYHTFASKIDSTDGFMGRCLEGEKCLPYNSDTDKLYRKFDLQELDGYKVSLYGMNTALISDWYDINDKGEGHKLFLPKLSYNAEVETEGHINIVMLHHPITHLVNGDRISAELDRNFVIQIFGHLHLPASDENDAIHIMSGAFQPQTQDDVDEKQYYPVYNILEMNIVPNQPKDKLNVALKVEKFDSANRTFEEVKDESRTFQVSLSTHVDRWANNPVEKHADLPEGVTMRKIRIAFLQKSNQKSYIDRMAQYDVKCSMSENCVRFLKKMEEDGRMSELWEELNKK